MEAVHGGHLSPADFCSCRLVAELRGQRVLFSPFTVSLSLIG